jgi:hypothetical protein
MANVCCGAFEKLAEEYPLPFYRPLKLDMENHNIVLAGWSIKLFHETAGGNVSKKSAPSVRVNYCPFCGVDLRNGDSSEEA